MVARATEEEVSRAVRKNLRILASELGCHGVVLPKLPLSTLGMQGTLRGMVTDLTTHIHTYMYMQALENKRRDNMHLRYSNVIGE